MQTITNDYLLASNNELRKPTFDVSIDWTLNNTFSSENNNVVMIEIERSVNEPEEGVTLSQVDISLSNETGRYLYRE